MSTIRKFSAVSAALLLGGIAQGRPNTYTSAGTGAWDDPASWTGNEPSGFPQATDTATIQNGHTISITVSGANNVEEVANLTIASGGFLEIEGSASYRAALEFPVVSGAGTPALSVAGADALKLKAYGELKILESMTFTNGGSGTIKGLASSAKIVLDGAAAAVTLTSNVVIHGALQIVGTSGGNAENFTNNAGVFADIVSEIMLLGSTLNTVSVGSGSCQSPNWKALGQNPDAEPVLYAELRFDVSVSNAGYFLIDAGALTIGSGVTVGGTYTLSNNGVINQGGSYGTFNGTPCS